MQENRLKWLSAAVAAAGLIASIAFAAATGDRLKSPVAIGQGTAVTEKIFFDTGHGVTNASLSSDGSGNMSGVLGAGTFTGTPTFSGRPTFSAGLAAGGNIFNTITAGSVDGLNLSMTDGSAYALVINNRTFGTGDAKAFRFLQGDSGVASIGNNNSTALTFDTSGNTTVPNALTASTGVTVSAGGLTVTGATTLNSTGGNVPHACVSRNSSATSGSCTVSCNAGEIAVGGGASGSIAQCLEVTAPGCSGSICSASSTPNGWVASGSSSCTGGNWVCYAVCCAF